MNFLHDMIKMTKKSFFLLLVVISTGILFQASCGKEDIEDNIPYVYVNFQINPNSIAYGNLNIQGNWTYVTGGYKGIIIYHTAIHNEYLAFERACPHDPLEDGSQLNVEDDNTIISCESCESKYLIIDGSPFDGPAVRSLKQYQAHFDGTYLHVSN